MVTGKLPSFKELGKNPPHNAWGVFGDKDELGTINLLTDEVVKEAYKELQNGHRVTLNFRLDGMPRPCFARRQLEHTIIRKRPERTTFADEININTQGSSQIDGLRHFISACPSQWLRDECLLAILFCGVVS